MDPETVDELRRLRNGLVGNLALVIACIIATTVAAAVAMQRSPDRDGLILGLVGIVDLSALAAMAVVVRRVRRRLAQVMSRIGNP